MAITFFNVNSGEKKTVDTEPLIAAFYNSTDQHVNAMLGQDFGWRLAPDTLVRIQEIKQNGVLMDRIAQAFNIPQGEVSDTDVVRWISIEDARKQAQDVQAVRGTYEKQYKQDVEKALESNNTDSADETDSAKINQSTKKEK